MSNTKKRANKFATWDELVAEVKKPAFELPLPDGETLYIEQPTGAQVFEAQELGMDGKARDQLRTIVGDDAYEVLLPMVEKAPGEVVNVLSARIMEHFGYNTGEAEAS